MRSLRQDITHLFKTRWSFKLGIVYLAGLLLLILLVPFLPLTFLPNELNLSHTFQKPFSNALHVLGTDQLGRDVLTNLLHGARNGLFIAIPVVLLSTLIGMAAGTVAGYFGNSRFRITYGQLLLLSCGLITGFYYLLYIPAQVLWNSLPATMAATSVIVGAIVYLFLWLAYPIVRRVQFLQKICAIPVDSFILRLIELLTSIPRIMLLIGIAAIASPSVLLLSVIFVCTYWTGTARLARAEMLRIVQLPYIEAAISTGMKHRQVIVKEAIPNLLTPVIVSFVFDVGALLAVESTLSFLGIGFPATFSSWGRLIASIRLNLSAWWLVAFPGGFLALTILALQTCSYHLIRISQAKTQ